MQFGWGFARLICIKVSCKVLYSLMPVVRFRSQDLHRFGPDPGTVRPDFCHVYFGVSGFHKTRIRHYAMNAVSTAMWQWPILMPTFITSSDCLTDDNEANSNFQHWIQPEIRTIQTFESKLVSIAQKIQDAQHFILFLDIQAKNSPVARPGWSARTLIRSLVIFQNFKSRRAPCLCPTSNVDVPSAPPGIHTELLTVRFKKIQLIPGFIDILLWA